jgi:hypothetical protein
MVAMILVRTLHRDLTKYNTVDPAAAEENAQEETGWKMIHGYIITPSDYFAHHLTLLVGFGDLPVRYSDHLLMVASSLSLLVLVHKYDLTFSVICVMMHVTNH